MICVLTWNRISSPLMGRVKWLTWLLLLPGILTAGDYWQQEVHYDMDVTLDTAAHTVGGTSIITYINHSPDTLDRVYLHLYPNAFQEGSVKYQEYIRRYGRMGRAARFMDMDKFSSYFSWVDVDSFQITQHGVVIARKYRIDDTILSALLEEPLLPGDSLTIEMEWVHHIGEQIERAGRVGKQYNLAQWYPKLVVYDEKGWHNVPFHAEGEFYGEFATFDVTMRVPSGYVIGATGVVVQGDPGWEQVRVDTSRDFDEWLKEYRENKTATDTTDTMRVVTFHAERVHDFAWITSPTFLYEHGSWEGIDIHVLFNEKNGKKWSKKVVERSERAIAWLSTQFGRYPYPQVTTTDRLSGGGMEYPMLVMNGSESEGLIVHEIGHIWFYGILGNNEVDEAWLDEGFTTFQTTWYLVNRYGPEGFDKENTPWYTSFQKKHWRFTSSWDRSQWSAVRYITSGHDEPIARSSYLFKNSVSYRQNAYTKPSLMLNELRYVLGDSLFLVGMRAYFRQWQLKHTNERRFITAMETTTNQDLDWFFNPWLHDTRTLDYAITRWKSEKNSEGDWTVTAHISQRGDRKLPLLLETELKDGTKQRTWWRQQVWKFEDDITYNVPEKPITLRLDPDGMTLDVDRRNDIRGRRSPQVVFRWPGMYYSPRQQPIVFWSPLLYYHELDGFLPGLWLTREYGPWVATNLKLNYGLKSHKLWWQVNGWRRPVHHQPPLWFYYNLYDQGSLRGGSAFLRRNWSPHYGLPPNFRVDLGFYTNNAVDTSRTDLYDPGLTTFAYGRLRMNYRAHVLTMEWGLTPAGLSDWDFSRLVATFRTEWTKSKWGLRARFIGGKLFLSERSVIPAQELFTVEGAGSGDLFSRPYLRDESSFYGITELRSRYHVSGDANLRGFLGRGLSGAQAVTATSVEGSFFTSPFSVNLELTSFVDGGVVWGDQYFTDQRGLQPYPLLDAGVGLRLKKNFSGYHFFLRFDLPFYLNENGKQEIDLNNWQFSLEQGL